MGRLLAVIVGHVVVLAAIAPSAGCAQIFGIENTNDDGLAGSSLKVKRLSIGKMVTTAPLDLTGLDATYLVESESAGDFEPVPAQNAGDGTWSSTLRDPNPVLFTLPDVPKPVQRMFSFPYRTLSIAYPVLEHADGSPAPAGATLGVMVDLDRPYVAADRFQVYTVGSWTSRPLPPGEILQMADGLAVQVSTLQPYLFASSSNVSGRPQLDRLTVDDAVLVLRYAGSALNGVAEAEPFNQMGTDTVVATGPRAMTAVAQDQTLDVKFETMLTSRYTAVRPAVTGLSMTWTLVAAPGYRYASDAGPVLHGGSLTPANAGLAITYGNPFVGREWKTIFTLKTSQNRVYTPAGTMTSVTLFAGMEQYIEPSPGYVLRLEAGLPVLISFDDRQLTVDGQMIPQPTKYVRVTFSADLSNNTLYSLQVYELRPNMSGTALELHLVFAAASDAPAFDVPPTVFEVGKSYTLRAITTLGGYPAIGSGDLSVRELPLSQSYLDSAVFTVTP
jgi:hypothetical protein